MYPQVVLEKEMVSEVTVCNCARITFADARLRGAELISIVSDIGPHASIVVSLGQSSNIRLVSQSEGIAGRYGRVTIFWHEENNLLSDVADDVSMFCRLGLLRLFVQKWANAWNVVTFLVSSPDAFIEARFLSELKAFVIDVQL
jgi:hypothetical protein